MEVNRSSWDAAICLAVAPSTHGHGLDLLELQQSLIHFSALPQHKDWAALAVQCSTGTEKCINDSKPKTSELCFEGNSIAENSAEEPTENGAEHPQDRGTALTVPCRCSLPPPLWPVILLGMFCTCSLLRIRFHMNFSASKVNTTWDKHKPLWAFSQLSVAKHFWFLKDDNEAFMYLWLCLRLLSCHVSRFLSSTSCTHGKSVFVFHTPWQ